MYEEVRFLKSPATVLNNIYMRMTDDSKVIIPLENITTRFENRCFFYLHKHYEISQIELSRHLCYGWSWTIHWHKGSQGNKIYFTCSSSCASSKQSKSKPWVTKTIPQLITFSIKSISIMLCKSGLGPYWLQDFFSIPNSFF